jgi:hypothetical protein
MAFSPTFFPLAASFLPSPGLLFGNLWSGRLDFENRIVNSKEL